MTTLIINSETTLQSAFGVLREEYHQYKYVEMKTKAGVARSLDQNAISHAWYEQLARELREDDAMGWKCYCKLHYGIPILRMDDDEFREFYDNTIMKLGYEQKLGAMKYMPVTSLMTKPQLSAYLVEMQLDFAKRGVRLEFPDEAVLFTGGRVK